MGRPDCKSAKVAKKRSDFGRDGKRRVVQNRLHRILIISVAQMSTEAGGKKCREIEAV